MLQSMTGYGKATCELNNKKVVVEIKSLNSKQLDLSTRISNIYREKELDIRNLINAKLERGKVDFSLYIDNSTKESTIKINRTILKSYVEQIKEIAAENNIEAPTEWFSVVMKMPDVLKVEMEELDENEWVEIEKAIESALNQVVEFRNQEGKTLENVFTEKINRISDFLLQVEPYESERVEKIKTRLEEYLVTLSEKLDYDKNRLEQELIFYVEKLDINEEKTRLRNHLDYFLETMHREKSAGKKLGFIAQEIGREINTLGSKSNHSEMQKIVVMMKDELEQIKEQILNTL
ncbi:YicC-like domain-containing protein [uncultured Paludibacter sp.]|uniref:YicC-like domain-containing protein n=1 Tax=uncultured Paludibacter sp. TaxID=497635 RepID=A0A653A6C4_9BACT|nr:YicC-like domain-containing protein [uncultured Paludibacter sp.]